MWPEVPRLRALLQRASRRLDWIAGLQGAAVGLAIALDLTVALFLAARGRVSSTEVLAAGRVLATFGLVAGVVVSLIRRRRGEPAAVQIERRTPVFRNVVVTAAELIDDPRRVAPQVGEEVCRRAARQLGEVDLASLFPSRRAVATLGAISASWIIAVTTIASRPMTPSLDRTTPGAPATVTFVDVVVTPPSYAGQPTAHLHDPSRIDALAGSRIHLSVRSSAAAVGVETLTGRLSLTATGTTNERDFSGDIAADADGFVAIEPTTNEGRSGVRRLIGLTVTPDHPPRVRITTPGKDMVLAHPDRHVDVQLDAEDDLGLGSLSLRYTKVSGSGEKFTFVEGAVPIAITAANERSWKARGILPLDSLHLEPGDVVVYKGVATDKRPGAPAVESDAFIIEITSPGMVASEGFALDDAEDKYALSQQMVILKTQRLLADAPSMAADSVALQAQTIAAEQRAVRAQFVFMMGGELAEEVIAAAGLTDLNEEAEAAGEADIAAGRLENRGRVALVQSIRFMSRANASLNSTDVAKALTEEKAALAYLQQAFSRTRYLLRALTQRERLDLARRLSGALATAGRDARQPVEPMVDARAAALRSVLAGIAELSGRATRASNESASASRLAQQLLAIDPSDSTLQHIATNLNDVSAASARGADREAERRLDTAATDLASTLRRGLLWTPDQPPGLGARQLDGELADALRRSRVGR